MPFLWTLFFFLLFCNLLGMIPLDSIIYLAQRAQAPVHRRHGPRHLAVDRRGWRFCAFMAIHVSGVYAVYHKLVTGTYGHHATMRTPRDTGHGDHHGHGMGAAPAAVLAIRCMSGTLLRTCSSPAPTRAGATRALLTVLRFRDGGLFPAGRSKLNRRGQSSPSRS